MKVNVPTKHSLQMVREGVTHEHSRPETQVEKNENGSLLIASPVVHGDIDT